MAKLFIAEYEVACRYLRSGHPVVVEVLFDEICFEEPDPTDEYDDGVRQETFSDGYRTLKSIAELDELDAECEKRSVRREFGAGIFYYVSGEHLIYLNV